MSTRSLWILYGASFLAAVAYPIATYGALPETVATRFNLDGEPTQTMNREASLAIWLLAVAMANMWAPLMRMVIHASPHMANVPNKAYWMETAERRSFVVAVSERMLVVIFTLTNFFLLYIHWSIVQVNLGERARPEALPALAVFLIALTVLIAINLRIFNDVEGWERMQEEQGRLGPVNKS